MTQLKYKGYLACVEIDIDGGGLHGEGINTNTVLTFEAQSAADLQAEFQATVDDYEVWCAERGVCPEKPYSGILSLRVDTELHRSIALLAQTHKISINQFIVEALKSRVAAEPATMVRELQQTKQLVVSSLDIMSQLGQQSYDWEGGRPANRTTRRERENPTQFRLRVQ